MIRFNDPRDGSLIGEAAGRVYNVACDSCIAHVRDSDGMVLGGTIFTDYTGASMNAHVGAFVENWITKDLLWVTFHYPFVKCGVRKLFGTVPESNHAALEFDRKLGFKEEARIRDVFPDGDMIILAMYREDCRWLKLTPRNLQPGV